MSATRSILYLFGLTLVELAVLPFHLLVFLSRRRAIRAEIEEILEESGRSLETKSR